METKGGGKKGRILVGPPVLRLNCMAWTHSGHLCVPNPLLKTTTMLPAPAQKLQKILSFAKQQIIFLLLLPVLSAQGDQRAESQPPHEDPLPHYKQPLPCCQSSQHLSTTAAGISAPKQAEK